MQSIKARITMKKAFLTASILLLMSGLAFAQQQVSLTAMPTSTTLPDGTTVPMWGYFCTALPQGTTSTATCTALNPSAAIGGNWSPVVITVPTGQGLQINLTNSLSFAVKDSGGNTIATNNVPTSLTIVGQLGGGLGTGGTTVPSPAHPPQGDATWSTVVNVPSGQAFTPPAQGKRVQSFGTEVEVGQTTPLTWTAPRPGTFLLESGTHPSIQGTMGLIGIVVVTQAPSGTTAGTAYPSGYLNKNTTNITYNADVPLILSEIDPGQNKAVYTAVTSQGFNEDATYGLYFNGPIATIAVTNGGSGYTTAPTVNIVGGGGTGASATSVIDTTAGSPTYGQVTEIDLNTVNNILGGTGYTSVPNITFSGGGGSGAAAQASLSLAANDLGYCQGPGGPLPTPSACYPPVVNYTPLYYLINGIAFSKTNPSASLFPVTPAGTTNVPLTGNVLVRFVNAGARMHVPSIVGSIAPNGAVGFQLIAEDGNVIAGADGAKSSRVQSEVFMAAGKVYDVMIQAPAAGSNALPVYDRELSLSGNSVNRDAGMVAYIAANGAALPSGAGAQSAVANPDAYPALLAGKPFTVSDPSKGVVANDINIYGVKLQGQATNGTVALNTDGTFTYTPNSGSNATTDQFSYCGNGATTGNQCAIVALNPSAITTSAITLSSTTWNSRLATYIKVPPPGVLSGAIDSNGLPLQVTAASIAAAKSSGVILDTNGGFTATGAPGTPLIFSITAQNSVGTTSGSASVTVNFPQPSNLSVTVKDPRSGASISDYRWIIEEDKSFYIDPGCTQNPPPANSTVTGQPCIRTTAGTVPILGVNFHTSDMTYVAQGCTGTISCESGQTVEGSPVVCDVGNGSCRPDTTGNGKTPFLPSQVGLLNSTAAVDSLGQKLGSLDPAKHYYISVLPGDAADPFVAGNTMADCYNNATAANCGHGMGGAPIAATCAPGTSGGSCTLTTFNPVNVLVEQSPYPPAKLAVDVFEDDFPLNGEQDSGGGVDILATNEPGLGDFNIVLWDDMGGSGDVTGQMTYDMFNQPLSNSLDGTIDPATGLDACPVTKNGVANATGVTGMITVCPTYESDGATLSPLAGEAVVSNLMPGRYSVQAIPGADRIARGEEWLQTNTLDGQKAHDSFLRIGEPAYFQEFGPANYHVNIGFANPAIINARKSGICSGNDPNLTAADCNYTVTGRITDERMSRTPDERLYSSGSYDAFAWTQCYVSLGDPDGEDFAFTKCAANGTFTLTKIPQGNWRVTVFDEWNDMIVDGLSTPVGLNVSGGQTSQTCPGPKTQITGSQTAGSGTCDMGDIATNQWQANVYTRTFIDPNGTGVASQDSPGVGLVNTTVRYRDGSLANNLGTDFNGVANFNETFPLFNWYVVETDTTRYKNSGTHTVYDAGGPADGSGMCGTGGSNSFPKCGGSTIGKNLANTFETNPLPSDLFVPGSIYCTDADCTAAVSAGGISAGTKLNPTCTSANGTTTCSTPVSTGRIDNPWLGQVEGWQGFSGQGNFVEFGKMPYAPGENGGIHGHVVYASTRPFDDPQLLVQTQWEPLVPNVTMNLYQEGVAKDGVTPTLTLVDTTKTTSWDAWAQGFHLGLSGEMVPNMNCPGQSTSDLFYFSLQNQPQYLDLYNNVLHTGGSGSTTPIPYNSQYKCYDGMHNWNQLQPAVYDGMYSFPSVTSYDANGKPNGSNCKACGADPAGDMYNGIPMLPAGKYVVEVVPPEGYEIVKEEDKNILIGDNFIAPVTQEFGALGDIFILPDQASVASSLDPTPNSDTGAGYNSYNASNPTDTMGATPNNGQVPGFTPEPVWPCVGESRVVPDYISLFPQTQQVSPFAGATRNLCDRKEVTLNSQMGAIAKFYLYTSTHKASKFTGVITDDFTSEFDPFSPQFGEKFAPPNMPISVEDWTGAEIGRVYSDWWGDFDGLVYSTWEVNPPNPTGYAPNMMVFCMNDKASGTTAPTDPLYNPAYSQFCYELPYMPGQTQYLDTPVVPTSAFSAGYNHPDCSYPNATPAIAEVDGDNGKGGGPWIAAGGTSHPLTIYALGDQQVANYAYSGPAAASGPYNEKTITRHYGFGTRCTSVAGSCSAVSTVTIGGVAASIVSWTDTQIVVTVPTLLGVPTVPKFALQQQAQFGGPGNGLLPANSLTFARGGQLVITAGNGQQSIDAVNVTVGGKPPVYVKGSTPLSPSGTGSIQAAIDGAQPGDLIMVPPGTYYEMLLMWKPVLLQGVGAASVTIDGNTQPAGKMDPWRRQVNCLFGLALDGTPIGEKTAQFPGGHPYDVSGTYTCGSTNGTNWVDFVGSTDKPQVDRVPLEGIVGWDTTTNGNLAQLLQEPTLMGAYEGAGITVLGKGVNVPSAVSSTYYGSGNEATFPTGTTNLTALNCGVDILGIQLVKNPYPSSFWCNPSRIDGLSITDSSEGGGGLFTHGWTHNLEIANNRVYSNIGTLSGGMNIGQGEFPDAYLLGGDLADPPGSCELGLGQPTNTQLPYCFQMHMSVHNNYVASNTSIGDELFSGTPAGAGGVSFCTGSDYYQFNYNWVCGNMSTGDGGGVAHIGFIKNGDIEHNSILFNQSLNPTIPTNGGGLIVMGAAPDGTYTANGGAQVECGSITDNDCAPGLSDGSGPGLVINANLIQGNAAEAGSGGGLRLQSVNGTDVPRFPNTPTNWYSVTVTNNIIVNNVAGWDGAGVSLQDSLVANIVNNTIASNDTTATAGPLTDTIGAPDASAPPAGGTTTSSTTSAPQAAGLVTMGNSSVLIAALEANPPTPALICPANHGGNGTRASGNATGNNSCASTSIPYIANDVFWQNRSFNVGVGPLSAAFQNNVVTLYNANFSNPTNGNSITPQTSTGQCVSGSSYWDIGARGDTGPGLSHASGVTLTPFYSSFTNTGQYAEVAATNGNIIGGNPSIDSQYCNGARTPPEYASTTSGSGTVPSTWNVPPGIADATVPNPLFTLTANATVDEGNNWINMTWGPLTMINPNTGAQLGNYALAPGSPDIDRVPTGTLSYNPYTVLATDFFGNPRPDVKNTAVDIGAVEYQAPPNTPILSVTGGPLNFGTVNIGSSSSAQTVTLANSGTATATGIALAVAGPFSRSGGTCSTAATFTLASGANCTIGVIFTPTAPPATQSGTLTITSTNVGTVIGSPVSLSGTGLAVTHTATVSPNPLAFGNWATGTTSNPLNLTVTNTGNAALAGGTVTFGGGTPQPYSRVTSGTFPTGAPNCGATLAVGASCTVKVQFAPGTTTGALNRTLTVAYTGATVTPSPVSLTGTGVSAKGTVAISPNPLTVALPSGTVSGSGTVTLTNNSGSASSVAVTGVTVSGTGLIWSWTKGTDNCTGVNLAPGASCTVQATFARIGSVGTHTGSISFTDTATGSPQPGVLTGVAH
ncbi:MAG TPA: choice-of-anchor D domain-containing protein [Acidobacteriaceae bacterium]|jgi:hypothetical protein|nr:choice-of-anchor D domain-containing protein [Acidobacteriaceae bacterium]